MGALGKLAARCAEAWMERFRSRHGLREASESQPETPILTRRPGENLLLHVGCGRATIEQIGLSGFHNGAWREIRLDADPEVAPDIVGTMTDMPFVPDASVDAVFSSHGIEHLYWHDVPRALAEFRRVLCDDGFLVVTCPDLQAAAQMIAEDKLFETAYVSAAGPITPFDIVYSYRPFVAANPQWMSHHCGFTFSSLVHAVREAGFAAVSGMRRPAGFDLWVLACKSPRTVDELTEMGAAYLPS